MKRIFPILFLVIGLLIQLEAQQKYWVYPKDKIENLPELMTDLAYYEVDINVYSKWLNAISVTADDCQLATLRKHESVKRIVPIVSQVKILKSDGLDLIRMGKALDQMNADTLISLGLNGTGVKVGIIDAGFMNAHEDRYLEEIITNEQVADYRNFIETKETDPYINNASINDRHGTKVFSLLAGKYEDNYAGLANGATFYLARTDQEDKEYRGEEDYWIAAVEWMHSQGVRIINSSLGYTNGFDNPEEDYTQLNVNGEFSTITQFTELAIREKNMTIVISAGNDGNDDFEIISIPADAEGVISVGSSGYRYWNKLGYSSIGPKHINDVKPEIACYAAGGTSFAAPVITGLVACLKEHSPEITNERLLNLLAKSSHLYPYPNNYLGYGVPDIRKTLKLLANDSLELSKSHLIKAEDSVGIQLDKSTNIMAFHKQNNYIVLEQEKLRWREGAVSVLRPPGASYTTVANGIEVWEIDWSN